MRTDEIRIYYCLHLAEHLAEEEADSELVALLEEGYLAEQARFTDSLAEVHRSLLQFGLPAARRLGDRHRLVTYAMALLHLARLGDALVEAHWLEGLVGSGRIDLARDIVSRLTDPYAFGRACAILLRSRPSSPESVTWAKHGSEAFHLWLRSGCPESGEAAVAEILRVLGKTLDHLWPTEIEGVAGDWSRLHGATALAYLNEDPITSAGVWRHIHGADAASLDEVARILAAKTNDRDSSWEQLSTRFERSIRRHPRVGWPLLATFYSRLGSGKAEKRTLSAMRHDIVEQSIVWSRAAMPTVDEIWSGRQLFGQWGERVRSGLASDLDEIAAALDLAALALGFEPYERLARLERFAAQCHISSAWFRMGTRMVDALDRNAPEEAGRWLVQLLGQIAVGFRVEQARDIVHFLAVVARLEPKTLGRAWRLIFVAHPSAKLLVDVARQVQQLDVMDALVDEVEALALLTTDSELESFRVRRIVLGTVLRTLLAETGDIEDDVAFSRRLEAIRLRLLREEWVDLSTRSISVVASHQRAALLAPLLEADGNHRALALVELRFSQGKWSSDAMTPVNPLALVLDSATIARIEDELEAIEVLVTVPLEIDTAVEQLVVKVQDEEIRQLALLRYAEAAIDEEERTWGHLSDRRGIVLGIQRAMATSSPRRLATLTPALIALGSRIDRETAAAETIEGMLQVMTMTSVPTAVRLDVLETLILTSVGRWVRGPSDAKNARLLGRVLRRALRIPRVWPTHRATGLGEDSVEESPTSPQGLPALRLWPLVIALLELLPTAWQQGSAPWLARARALCMPTSQEHPWWRREIERLLSKNNSDVVPHSLSALCLAPPSRRLELVHSLSDHLDTDPELASGAAMLVLPLDTELACGLLRRVPLGERRDRALSRVLQVRRLGSDRDTREVDAVVSTLASTSNAALRILLLGREPAGEESVDLWLDAMARGVLDPIDPELESMHRHLRHGTSRIPRRRFELAVLSAAGRGAEPLERALRFYLHYCLGEPDVLVDHGSWEAFVMAVRRSRELFSIESPALERG